MKRYISFAFLLAISFSAISQDDEQFVNLIYKDFLNKECDSFLLITAKESLQITDNLKSDLKKIIPKKAVRDICLSSSEVNKTWEWDTIKMNNAIPIDNDQKRKKEREFMDDLNYAYETFLTTYGLDTISDSNISDSLQNTIVMSGVDVYNFSKIPSCYRQMYKFSRPLFSRKYQYAIIAFTNHRWLPNASGYIAVYENKNGRWIRIAEINHWAS